MPALGLARAHRPALGQEAPIPVAAVEAWVAGVRTQGVRSVICLLGTAELKQYAHLAGGLEGQYRRLGLDARFIPVDANDSVPHLTERQLSAVAEAFRKLPKPVVVHCSLGRQRSGQAVRNLIRLHAS